MMGSCVETGKSTDSVGSSKRSLKGHLALIALALSPILLPWLLSFSPIHLRWLPANIIFWLCLSLVARRILKRVNAPWLYGIPSVFVIFLCGLVLLFGLWNPLPTRERYEAFTSDGFRIVVRKPFGDPEYCVAERIHLWVFREHYIVEGDGHFPLRWRGEVINFTEIEERR